MTYLHPSLEPVLKDSMGVILYQEQVMRIAIEVAGFSPAESDGFRRAMGTWRSSREMEKLHRRFVDGCLQQPGMTEEDAEELFRQVAAFASFARQVACCGVRPDRLRVSAFQAVLPRPVLVGLINAQPMGFYPVEVLVNDTKRHGVAVLPVDINASSYKTTTEWVGPDGQPEAVVSSGCVVPSPEARASALDAAVERRLGRATRCTSSRASASSTRRCSTPNWRAGRIGAWWTSSSGLTCPRRFSSGSSAAGRWTRWVDPAARCCGSSAR